MRTVCLDQHHVLFVQRCSSQSDGAFQAAYLPDVTVKLFVGISRTHSGSVVSMILVLRARENTGRTARSGPSLMRPRLRLWTTLSRVAMLYVAEAFHLRAFVSESILAALSLSASDLAGFVTGRARGLDGIRHYRLAIFSLQVTLQHLA